MWFTRMRRCASLILLRDLPTYLGTVLRNYIIKDTHLNNLQNINQQIEEEGQVETFDLINCGPRHRYAIHNLITHNSDDYGSGAYKKWQSLKIQGFDFTMSQVEEMHNKLAEVYKGKKAFGEKLKMEWERNRGFVLDGFGFPVCVYHKKIKDLGNRVIQKSGHMILQLWTYLIVKKLWEENIDYSFQIYDFHDELITEVHYTQIQRVKEIYAETLAEVNTKYLQGQIKIKAEPQVATCLAEIKVENYIDEDLKHLMDKLS